MDAMRLFGVFLFLIPLALPGRADVEAELKRMLASHPDADANGDGTLTEKEAADYIVRTRQGGRTNRGTGIGDRSLIEAYEARRHQTMPYRLMKPLGIEQGKRYPLIVSLHGSGGVGDDNLSNLRRWNGVMARTAWREKHPAYVLVPQRRPGGIWGPKPDLPEAGDLYVRDDLPLVFEIIGNLEREFPIDEKRIYALGSSGGGAGTWNIIAARPELFAAAIPVCGRFKPADAPKLAHLPIWCFHGDADPLISVKFSRDAFARLSEAGGNMKYTELRGIRHPSWEQAFVYTGDDASRGFLTRYSSPQCDRTADVWEWLFRQSKR